jgi:general secretion pathway protein D
MTSLRHTPPRLLAGLLLSGLLAAPAFAQFQGQGNTGARRTGSSGTAREYPSNTQVGDAVISVDPETRKIVVVTDEETNLQIKEVIQSLDQPRPQVLIKVVFLEVTHNNALDYGVEGGRSQKIGDVGTGKFANAFGQSGINQSVSNSVLSSIGQDVTGFGSTSRNAGLYQMLGTDYEVTLRAIAQAGNAEVLSRPSILARNNQPATISLGQQVPIVASTTFNAINGQVNNVTYQNVGIILRVTPFISPDGMVEMIVSPETSALADRSQWVPISADASAPVINSRVADTVVVVPDGQTVVIGGLMQTQQNTSESKVPLLGDIPWLGNLFKRTQKSNSKTELMIFLTPHVIPAASQLAALTAEERANATLKPKSISEEQLDKILGALPSKNPEDIGKPAPKKGKK